MTESPTEHETMIRNISELLYTRINDIIIYDLTTQRELDNLIAYNDDEILEFIKFNKNKIMQTIEELIEDYDAELSELMHPELDLIREYLYDYVRIPVH